jgi:hypothetical protein
VTGRYHLEEATSGASTGWCFQTQRMLIKETSMDRLVLLADGDQAPPFGIRSVLHSSGGGSPFK